MEKAAIDGNLGKVRFVGIMLKKSLDWLLCCWFTRIVSGGKTMMGPRQVAQGALFYEFSIEEFVPSDHPLRGIDRFLDLSEVRPLLAPSYSSHGRPSIDPELMIRMLFLGYCQGIRSERRLCEEVNVNLAYRWCCRLDLPDAVPDHSTFSKNRHGRFRESDLFRHLFETVLRRCIAEGLVGGESFGVDASLIPANADQTRGIDSKEGLSPELTTRVVDEYLETLDDAAFGGSTKVILKYISPVDPAARWTGADGGAALFAHSTNYMVDLDNAVIVDVEPSVPIRATDQQRCWAGWSKNAASPRTSRSGISRSGRTAHSHARVLSMTQRPTATDAQATKNYGHIAGTSQNRESPTAAKTGSSDTMRQNTIAMHAR